MPAKGSKLKHFFHPIDETLLSSYRSAFKVCEKSEGLAVTLWGITLQVYCCPSQVRVKRYCLTLFTGVLKKALHKSVTEKILLSVGMKTDKVWGWGQQYHNQPY